MVLTEIRQQLARQAVIMRMRPEQTQHSEFSSWYGKVACSLPAEIWPLANGKPMFALCQIDLTELPVRPPILEDIAVITVFAAENIGSGYLYPNGSNWLLRAYSRKDHLVPLIAEGSYMQVVPLLPEPVREDFPCWEDVNIDIPTAIAEHYYDHFSTVDGIKLGGWPNLVQNRINWENNRKFSAAKPEFAFQIDSPQSCNRLWGNNGVAYIGRGTRPGHENEWFMEWQSI